MSLSFVVVCEASPDQQTACALADRLCCAEVDWIEEEMLDNFRVWRGLLAGSKHLAWKDVHDLAKARKVQAHGHFEGEPGVTDAHAGRLALLLIKYDTGLTADAVLLIRDSDRDPSRRDGLEQARRAVQNDCPVIIGLAHPKREAWVLAGFEPRDEAEHGRLAALRQELGFDPRSSAFELTAIHDRDKKSAKRVLAELTGRNRDREAACWLECELVTIEERGRESGLADYLQEIRTHLVPMVSGRAAG